MQLSFVVKTWLAVLAPLTALAVVVAGSSAACAQGFPSKPIRILVPYPAGGTTDLMARALQEPLQKSLGQPVVVENKPGAGGLIAAREVARSAPDGHTLLFINSGIVAVAPFVVKDPSIDGIKDFSPIALVSLSPLFLVIPASVPANDLKGFIDYLKQQTSPVDFASAGTGSFGHLASELFPGELMERFHQAALEIPGMRATLSQGAPGNLLNGRFEQGLRHSLMWVISIGTNEIQRSLIAQRGLGLPRCV